MKIVVEQIFSSLRESGKIPHGWKPARHGIRRVKIKNLEILRALREHEAGEWRKVYQRGIEGTEIHYFEHSRTKKVWGVTVK